MVVNIQRTYFKGYTEYRALGYDIKYVIPEDIPSDETEAKMLSLVKRRVAQEMENEIQFVISTCEK